MIAEEPEKSKGQEEEQVRKRKGEGAAMYTVKETEYVYTIVKEEHRASKWVDCMPISVKVIPDFTASWI